MLKRYLWARNLVFVGLLSFLSSQIANRVVLGQIRDPGQLLPSNIAQPSDARKPKTHRSLSYYKVISERNIFNSEHKGGEDDKSSGTPSRDPVKQAELNVELIGTVVGAPESSFAFIEDKKTKEQELYQINDMIQETARILSISRCKVVLLRNGAEEILACSEEEAADGSKGRKASYRPAPSDGAQDVRQVSDKEYLIDQGEVDKALENMNVLMTQIRVVPNFENGVTNGFKVFSIKPNSIFDKIGLKNGDVIQRINDHDITTPDKAFQVFNDLRTEKSLVVEITRRGQKQSLNYEIR